MDDLVTRLGRVKHFGGLPKPAIEAIVAAGQIRRFDAGSVIFLEGHPCAGMFVLLSGRVHLCKSSGHDQQEILGIIEPVIMFNEVAVLDGGPNPLTALAVQACLTWSISCDAFHALVKAYPQVGLGLLPVLAARSRILISRYEDLASRSVLARTAKLLLFMSDFGERPIDRREHSVDELSARVGSVREPVSRALRLLREEGLIAYNRTLITVSSAKELAERALVELNRD